MADAEPLNIYVVTFNCARRRVDPTALARGFFTALPPDQPPPDILAVSLQEVAPIAYAFLGGALAEPYFEAVARAVALAAAERAASAAAAAAAASPSAGDGAGEDGGAGGGTGGEGYARVLTRHVGMTALMLFVRAPLRGRVRRVVGAGTGVGLWRMGNKGAVAVRFALEGGGAEGEGEDGEWEGRGVEITIVAAHLAPMEWNVPRRKWDFEHIVSDLVFRRDPVPSRETETGWESGLSSDTVDHDQDSEDEADNLLLASSAAKPSDTDTECSGIYDTDGLVIFAGDLNYRTSDTRPRLSDHATFPQPADPAGAPNHFLGLLARDQLSRERADGSVFQHFAEAPVAFPPTYKHLRRRSGHEGGERWAWAWHRWPSWCDRVLYLPSPLVRGVRGYAALPVQPTSDHRPVALALAVDAGAGRTGGGRRFAAPVPLNRHAVEERAAAKGREFAVGFLAYLVLTPVGNAIVVGVVAGGLAFWYLMHRLVLA
jgi:hypothetical protein